MSIQCVKISQIYNLPASEWNENNESNKTTLKLKTDFKLKKTRDKWHLSGYFMFVNFQYVVTKIYQMELNVDWKNMRAKKPQ